MDNITEDVLVLNNDNKEVSNIEIINTLNKIRAELNKLQTDIHEKNRIDIEKLNKDKVENVILLETEESKLLSL